MKPGNAVSLEEGKALLARHAGRPAPQSAAMTPKPLPAARAMGRTLAPRKMNAAERAYSQHLEARRCAGEIADYRFEEITLRIGDDCRYTPDFDVMLPSGALEFHEVKVEQQRGAKVVVGIEEDARAKLRAAAAHHWWYVFRLAVRKLDGSWSVEEIRP